MKTRGVRCAFKRGLAGLASVGAVLPVGALAPSAAMAHPCISETEAASGRPSLHTGGNWAGSMPSFAGSRARVRRRPRLVPVPVRRGDRSRPGPRRARRPGRLAAGFQISNLTPLGYSAREVPIDRRRLERLQLGPRVQGQPGHRGHLRGLPHHRRHGQGEPDAAHQLHGLQGRPGRRDRLRQPADPLVGLARRARARPAPASSSAQGFEGIHIFDISNPAAPRDGPPASHGVDGQRRRARRSAAARTPRPPCRTRPRLPLHLQRRLSGTCNGIDIFRISFADPTDAVVHRAARTTAARAVLPRQQRAA